MNKVLIVENEMKEFEKYCSWFQSQSLVNVTDTLDGFLQKSKVAIIPGVDFNNYEFVFIHKSYKGAPEFDSEIIDKLKEYVQLNDCFSLITYSGGSSSSMNNALGRSHHVTRKTFEDRIKMFVEFSIQIGRWYKTAFFFENYKTIFLKSAIQRLETEWNEQELKVVLNIIGIDHQEVLNLSKDRILSELILRFRK